MPAHYGNLTNPKMTYQQYVKARSQHMKEQGTALSGAERMKKIGSEWSQRGKGIAMQGGSFADIVNGLKGFLGSGLENDNEPKMKGKGIKSVLKKVAKYALPLAGSAGLAYALSRDDNAPLES